VRLKTLSSRSDRATKMWSFPVVAYYGAGRLWERTRERLSRPLATQLTPVGRHPDSSGTTKASTVEQTHVTSLDGWSDRIASAISEASKRCTTE